MTLDATNEAKDSTFGAVVGPGDGILVGFKCLPAKPSRIGKEMTLGIQAKLSNLIIVCVNTRS